jgi:very-short-patch-repair endonuclease
MTRSPHLRHHVDAQRAPIDVDRAIAGLAGRQHGVIARSQLVALGLGRGAIARRIERERLHVLHRGVYAVGHRALTRRGAWMAAVLVAEGAVLSHRSAAALWGVLGTERRNVEITVPRHVRPRPRIDVHEGRLPPDEVTTHDGILVTTPARILLDLAAVVSPQHLERAATEAEIHRLGSPTSLAALVARYPTRTGTKTIRRLLNARDIGRNITKQLRFLAFLAFLDAHRLPRPRINATVDVPPKPREVDCLWPDHRLIAELDGFAAHGTRTAFEEDRDRDRALLVSGYRVTRITWRQIAEEEEALADALRSLLDPARAPDH